MTQSFTLLNPEQITIVASAGGGSPTDAVLQESNWIVDWYSTETVIEPCPGGTSNYAVKLYVEYTGGPVPYNVTVQVTTNMDINGNCTGTPVTANIRVNAPNSNGYSKNIFFINNWSSTCVNGSSFGFESAHWPAGIANCNYYIDQISAVAGGGGSGGSGTETATFFTSQVTSSAPCLYFISESNELVFNSTIAYYYNRNRLVFNSNSDPYWTGSLLDVVILPFELNTGDRISLYDSASRLGWNERSEYIVKNTRVTGSGVTGSRLLVELDRPANLALFITGSTIPADDLTNAPWRACRYVVWKHVPDETNVMLRYNPKDSTIVENGILFPQYIDETVRDNSGNVVKSLKQQNLIDPNTNTLIFQ